MLFGVYDDQYLSEKVATLALSLLFAARACPWQQVILLTWYDLLSNSFVANRKV